LSEISSKRIHYLAAVAIVAIVMISVIAATRPITIQTPSTTPQPKTLQVTGEGTVSAIPDEAILLLAVQTQSTSASQASSDNADLMSKVIDALVSVGVSKTSIETVSYSLTPMCENKPDQTTPPRILGYVARNAIQVTITDFGLVGKALDTAIGAGINEVQGVVFTLSDASYAAIEKQALQLAIQDADAKAKGIASNLGATLVGPISITPGYTFQPAFERLATAATQTPIQPGSLQVTANVQIVYEFT
jgi:uncharacterized protein YggE